MDSAPTIHEADLSSGANGAVEYGAEIGVAAAVVRRLARLDVVVRGSNTAANRSAARNIEAAVGPETLPQRPHRRAGAMALPHFHQQSRNPSGHTFYETENRKARRKP